MEKLVIFGAGGHAKVVADIALKNGFEIDAKHACLKRL